MDGKYNRQIAMIADSLEENTYKKLDAENRYNTLELEKKMLLGNKTIKNFKKIENLLYKYIIYRFLIRFGVTGVMAAVDGTKIYICPPPNNDPEHPERVYIGRDGKHSLNACIVSIFIENYTFTINMLIHF